jgi:hypothetical protein
MNTCQLEYQAGLFSAVASAFIIEVNSQLQSNPGDETAALLRVLIYKIDNTTFGNDIPSLPQWTGPPRAMVHVQAILFASLAASLFSAFLAMLGKQWLNRYDATDTRGSIIERCQNRQGKLDGIVAWYFDYVMELLPLMLQAALLLLSCALSQYLWDISITVMLVVLGVTSFGVFFYLFIAIAGAISDSCPYQTPGSHLLRYLGQKIYSTPSAFRHTFRESARAITTIAFYAPNYHPWWSRDNIVPFLRFIINELSSRFATDVRHLGQTTIRGLSALPGRASRIFWRLDRRTTVLDLRCVSWTLQTSLDEPVRFSTLEHLMTMPELADFDSSLVSDCFDVFVGCINFIDNKPVVTREQEKLARVSSTCFLRTFRCLIAQNPTSGTLEDLSRCYRIVVPPWTGIAGLQFDYTMVTTHALVRQHRNSRGVPWNNNRPSAPFSQSMVETAGTEYR